MSACIAGCRSVSGLDIYPADLLSLRAAPPAISTHVGKGKTEQEGAFAFFSAGGWKRFVRKITHRAREVQWLPNQERKTRRRQNLCQNKAPS